MVINMAENTREIVLDVLLEMERSGEYSHRLIKAVLDKFNYLDSQEKSFIKRLSEGTVERKLELDFYLNQFSSVPVKKMKPLIRCLLRMSVYQILYMDSVPDSAACNEAVKLAGKRKFQNLKGFVNGVLRGIAKNKEAVSYPDMEEETLSHLSVKYSCPEWLVEMWLDEYGRESTAKLLEGLLAIRPVTVRFRLDLESSQVRSCLDQMEKLGVRVKSSSYLSNVFTLENVDGVAALPGYENGLFTVQDVSSALCVEGAGIGAGDFVMDICAAPGGKSMAACQQAGSVLARDISENKLERILENKERMKADNLTVELWDAVRFDEERRETADILIMDVPCSGLGVMGRKRDIKYNVTPEGLKSIVTLQKEIMRNSWQYVKPGGILLYSTCTIHKEENEEMLKWICQEFPFEPDSLKPFLPACLWKQKEELEELLQKAGRETEADRNHYIQLLPGYMDADGFFFARLRRKQK